MRLFRLLFRVLLLALGALIGLGLFLFAVLAFVVFMLVSLLTGRKPKLQFRASRNPWAGHQAPAGDVVDVEVREVPEQPPRALQPPGRS